ncbi:MAG: type III-B CRISPR module RAMP protein Cmr4 [Actinomycetota bacterium]|nr:type III-B CRISPR module RAMP protein Cmr4 [Actinomycetota bacterium]
MEIKKLTYLIMTLDPVHVGTGGYRLARVDNAIVREPGTNLPKIPGTSLHGSIQSAAAMRYGDLKLAGQNKKGKPDENPIIYTFGAGEQGGFSSGVVSIHDARILLFPIASQDGPVWITTASILNDANFSSIINGANGKRVEAPSSIEKVILAGKLKGKNGAFAIGWLMLNVEKQDKKISYCAPDEPKNNWKDQVELEEALSRTVIVHESLFPELVNSNLEVRTSVAIEPETGAAADGALFTYEAIPRATFMTFDVVIDNYRNIDFPIQNSNGNKWSPRGPSEVVSGGLELLEYLGVGGMGTRGFGRIKIIGEPI